MLPVGAAFTLCLHIVLCIFTPLVQFHISEQLLWVRVSNNMSDKHWD